ncbi:outer membrane beta-barrel protein [Labilibacter marinus]|uniref:outer membrane beta-barrel protein n=1 Tax=Labilibacter marinus TaxID=1477105 RepID=UPI00094FCE79|nr:outer membrane beta-barrel protein [Labilibacter marinus]
MKRLLLIAVVLTATSTMFAQFKLGGGLTLGNQISANQNIGGGLNVRANYSFNERITLSTGYTYIIPSYTSNNRYTSWQINGDIHYNYLVKEKYSLYGLAGINYNEQKMTAQNYSYSYDPTNGTTYGNNSTTEGLAGINLGLGATYKKYFGEIKYDAGYDQVALTMGFIF